jgi:hypothetical protein
MWLYQGLKLMSISNGATLSAAKYLFQQELIETIFKYAKTQRDELICDFCIKNSQLYKEALSPILYAGKLYLPKHASVIRKSLHLHKELKHDFVEQVVKHEDKSNYELSLITSYISACLTKSKDFVEAKSYLHDCLQKGATKPVNLQVKEEIEANHEEAIQIIKKHLTIALLT